VRVRRLGSEVGTDDEIERTGLLERRRCWSRRRRGKFEIVEMALSVKSIESSWSFVTPRFSIAGILWPNRRERLG
jgi:hypothetical protein